MGEMKALPPKSLQAYCDLYTFAEGRDNITCPADDIHPSCLNALERRGLVMWDTERVGGRVKRWAALTKYGAQWGCETLAVVPHDIMENRQRVCVSLFLDMDNPDHRSAYRIIQSLKQNRVFTPTLVDALLMHSEFLHGETDVLQEAYPGIYRQLTEAGQQAMMQRIEVLLASGAQSFKLAHNQGVGQPVGLRGIEGANQAPMPVFEDEEVQLTVTTDEGAMQRVYDNFRQSVLGLLK